MPQLEKYEAPRLGQVVTLNVGFMERLRYTVVHFQRSCSPPSVYIQFSGCISRSIGVLPRQQTNALFEAVSSWLLAETSAVILAVLVAVKQYALRPAALLVSHISRLDY